MDDTSLDSRGAESVPSGDYANGLEVLASRLARADRVQIAVAFVSLSGVRLLRKLLANERPTSIEVVARGADATSPDALISLQDDLGASVSAVMGKDARAFHPKLWLIRNPECLTVMSGSGNLTRGGLVANQEQFEVLEIDPESDEAQAQEERFDLLTSKGKTLKELRESAIWDEWLSVIKEQKTHRDAIERIGSNLANREVKTNRERDKQVLLRDLFDLYEATSQAGLRTQEGRRYTPSRFLQSLNRCRDDGQDPVKVVYRLCDRQTGGFDVILQSGRRELTVEQLVADRTKPYHDLFSKRTLGLAQERLRQFDTDDST